MLSVDFWANGRDLLTDDEGRGQVDQVCYDLRNILKSCIHRDALSSSKLVTYFNKKYNEMLRKNIDKGRFTPHDCSSWSM